jgi:hypothetical protein
MIKWILSKITKMEAKDPNDASLTINSGAWSTGAFCEECKATPCHEEWMADICNSCGFIGDHKKGVRGKRTFRRIYNGKKWITQIKYSNKTYVLTDD